MDHRIDADQFAAHLIVHGLADNTVRNYRCLFVRWCDFAHTRRANPMRPDALTVRAWAASMDGSRALLAQARATIGHLCRILEVSDVSAAVPLPRRARTPRTRALEPEQARSLARAADRAGTAGLAVLVGLYTGARRSEIASLAWRNIDFDRGEITLVRSKIRDLLTLPLATPLAARLEQRHVPGDLWVFPGRHGGHVTATQIWQWVREVAEQAGIGRTTTHQLRHTFGTDIHDQTSNVRIAQDAMGHESLNVTAGYTRVTRRQLRDAIEGLDYLDDGDEPAAA